MKKMFCSGSFGLALLCFCLPWVTVSCQQQKMISSTGIELVSGMEVAEPGSALFGGAPKKHKVEPNGLAILALIAAVAGFGLSFAGGGASALPALAGIAGAIALKTNLDQEILKQGQGLFQINYEFGFIGYMIAMAVGLLSAFVPDGSSSVDGRACAEEDSKKCPQCAEEIRRNALVCRHCGAGMDMAGEGANPAASSVGSGPAAASMSADTGESPTLAPSAAKEPKARFCFQCGASVLEGSLFCCECGVRLVTQPV